MNEGTNYNWLYDEELFQEKPTFVVPPEGDHRVRISSVEFKTFASGNEGYQIEMKVSGYNYHVRYFLVLLKHDRDATNRKIGEFFNCFGIVEKQLGNGQNWVGKVGGARLQLEEYEGNEKAEIRYLMHRNTQDKLPAWKEVGGNIENTASKSPVFVKGSEDDLDDLFTKNEPPF